MFSISIIKKGHIQRIVKLEHKPSRILALTDMNGSVQLLLLPHSLFPCLHGMLRYRSRGEERMMYSCLEKELGPSLLVGRLSEHSCYFLSIV